MTQSPPTGTGALSPSPPSTLALIRQAADNAGLPRDWRAVEITPGTPYPDEPSETIPPGWYVTGGHPAEPSVDEGARLVLRVEQAIGPDDTVLTDETLAKAVADRLNGGAR